MGSNTGREEWTYVGFAGKDGFKLAAPAAHVGRDKLNDLVLHVVRPEVKRR